VGGVWLAIDTATDIASVAVGKPPDTEAGVFVQGARRHAAEIIVLVDHALEQAGVRSNELEGIVVGDGPGSFTGLRIGWAAAKGLAQQAGLSLAAVPRSWPRRQRRPGSSVRCPSPPATTRCGARSTGRSMCSAPTRWRHVWRRPSRPWPSWRASLLHRTAPASW